jgi:dihydrofolate reductase
MGSIVISTNASLDGVVEDPDGQEGSGAGGWFTRSVGEDRDAWTALEFAEASRAGALLLGRRSDEWFATRWTPRDTAFARRLNGLPKYVVSATLTAPCWSNATVLRGDVVDEVTRLKGRVDGEILVYGSYRLGRTLIEHDLVDELRLVVLPVVVGTGRRLLEGVGGGRPPRLVGARTVGAGLASLTYAFG